MRHDIEKDRTFAEQLPKQKWKHKIEVRKALTASQFGAFIRGLFIYTVERCVTLVSFPSVCLWPQSGMVLGFMLSKRDRWYDVIWIVDIKCVAAFKLISLEPWDFVKFCFCDLFWWFKKSLISDTNVYRWYRPVWFNANSFSYLSDNINRF